MSPRPAAHARDHDRGRRGAADRRRRVRRAPVAGRTTTRSTPTSANGVLIDSNDPRFLRGKIEAIGADVLYGVGAIVAMTAVFGLFSHGPDSTGVADSKKVSLTPTMGPDGGGLSLWGQLLMRARASRPCWRARSRSSLAGAGCDWRKFDDLKKNDAGRRISAPADYSAKRRLRAQSCCAVPPPARRIGGGALRGDGDVSDVGRGRLVRRRRQPERRGRDRQRVRHVGRGTDHGDRGGSRRAAGVAGRARGPASATCC